jgi:nucleotide-binding universal stress UspA family protein
VDKSADRRRLTAAPYVSPFDERRRVAEPLAARPVSLEGTRVALLDINKRRGDEFLDRIEELLRARGAVTSRFVKEIFSKPAAPDIIRRIADRGDLAVEGLAD